MHKSVALTHIPGYIAWMMGTPRDVSLSEEDVPAVVSSLVPAIAAAVAPETFDKVTGPEYLVNALLEAWASHMNALGIPEEEQEKGWLSWFG